MNQQTFQYKIYKGRTYLLVAMQNSTTGIIFENLTESKHFTNQDQSKYKFSILDEITNTHRYDNSYYEFLLCYPEKPICNRWKQTKSPTEYTETTVENDTENNFIGYESIDSSFEMFKGLMISKQSYSYLEGAANIDGDWWYAIGVYKEYEDYSLPGIIKNEKGIKFHYYELFLRVPNLINQKHLHLFHPSFILSYIFILNK